VLDRESISITAGIAMNGLLNATSLNISCLFTTTFEAEESSLLHFRNDI
jgi:hypothetical protein